LSEESSDNIEEVRRRALARFMPDEHVVGVAVGEAGSGRPAIVVLADRALPPGHVPEELEGHPVRVEIVGEVRGDLPPDEGEQ
jgi:ATP-dependent Clp protease ATP-binding subunit ClpA